MLFIIVESFTIFIFFFQPNFQQKRGIGEMPKGGNAMSAPQAPIFLRFLCGMYDFPVRKFWPVPAQTPMGLLASRKALLTTHYVTGNPHHARGAPRSSAPVNTAGRIEYLP